MGNITSRTVEVSNMDTGGGRGVCFRNRTAVVLMLTHYSCKLIENGHTSIHVNPLKFGSVSAMRFEVLSTNRIHFTHLTQLRTAHDTVRVYATRTRAGHMQL
jgi:hypothetical protein